MGENEKELVSAVIDNGFPNDGPYTAKLESKIAEFLGVPYAVAVTSCTVGLYLSLMSLEIGYGDEVLVPDITFISTANAVTMTGAKPVLVDVELETFGMCPRDARSKITERTRAIIPVHVSGRPANLPALLAIAKEHNLLLIEDAAEALGSASFGAFLGTFGHCGCFSFSPAKSITTGQGGMIVTRDPNTHQRLRELKDQGRRVRGTGGDDIHTSLGFNFKFTDLQAAVGLAQFSTIDQRLKRLRRHYEIYSEKLKTDDRIKLPKFDLASGACPQWVDIFISEGRDNLHQYLKERRMECRKFWFPIHTQEPYRLADKGFPNSIEVSRCSMWLPSALTLTDQDILLVCNTINEWAKLSIQPSKVLG